MEKKESNSCINSEKFFEQSQAQLVMATLQLEHSNTTLKQLFQFIDAALTLYQASKAQHIPMNPIDVLFWLRQRLIKETKDPEKNTMYRSQCHQYTAEIEKKIALACTQNGRGDLSLL